VRDAAVRAQMAQIRERFPYYGYRCMTHALQRAKWPINHKRVRRLLDPLPVRRRRVQRFIPHTTAAQHAYCRYPNLLLGRTLCALNEAWVADITYVRLPTTFLYFAGILDAYSRRCIGWELAPWLDTRLTLAALDRAVLLRQPPPGLIHHSDQGVQYASTAYSARLRSIGALSSMAMAANPYENAIVESFLKTLRHEELNLKHYHTYTEAYVHIQTFIELYNTERLHSSLGYRPPSEFETRTTA
jgi:transposase InsO family protein